MDFERQITKLYAIICEGWPLPQFQSPHHFNVLEHLVVLYNAWYNGATHFRKLTAAEHKTWVKAYEDRLASTPWENVILRKDMEDTPPTQPVITQETINHAPTDNNNPPVVPSVTMGTEREVTPKPSRGRKRKAVNEIVFTIGEEPGRKRRSDYGKKHGSYKKKGNALATDGPRS